MRSANSRDQAWLQAADALHFTAKKWTNMFRNKGDSIYFYTMHKSASTLFSDFVLKNLIGLRHVDYIRKLYDGRLNSSRSNPLVFRPRGHVYGPIRVSSDGTGVDYSEPLNGVTVSPDFVRDKVALFFVRDPRDILVSSYYSFGATHTYSARPDIRRAQGILRSRIQDMSIDDYALEFVQAQVSYFETIHRLSQSCRRGALMKYEDMIDNFDYFAGQLTQHIDVHPHVVRQMYRRSRPRRQEAVTSHRRSGKTGGFRHKLQPSTIAVLNHQLSGVLQTFDYPL
ncbi:MAG: hypothetical protein VKN13_01400 [Cyanobacteriota bacterium]|nr:hypothetical protein [Cyanobacteriota bacterium]